MLIGAKRRVAITGLIQVAASLAIAQFALSYVREYYLRLVLLTAAIVNSVMGVCFLAEALRRGRPGDTAAE